MTLWSDKWYIVASRAELDERYVPPVEDESVVRFFHLLGDNQHNRTITPRHNTTLTYYEELIKEYKLPIFKIRLLSTFPLLRKKFYHLIEDHPR